MRHMGACHEEAAVADPRHHAAAGRSGVHRDLLADDIVPADDKPRLLAPILQILRLVPDRGEGKDAGAFADLRPAGNHHVRDELDVGRQLDQRSHMAVRANAHGIGELGPRLDDRRRMNVRHETALSCP